MAGRDPAQGRYRSEDIREILRLAQRTSGTSRSGGPPGEGEQDAEEGLTQAELVETAREVGIPEAQVQDALVRYEGERQLAQAQQEVRQLAYRRFSAHLISFLLLGGLYGGGALTLGLPLWALFPVVLWALFLLLHLRDVLFPDPDQLRQRAQARIARQRLKDSTRELGQAFSQGAAALFSATAKKIEKTVDQYQNQKPPRRHG